MFNSPLPIRWTKKTASEWQGSFVVQGAAPNPENPARPIRNRRALPGGKQYIIKMIKSADMPWEVIFELVTGETAFAGRSQNITGTGDAVTVFATVLSGIQQWLSAVKPDAFALSAREPSRQSLYRRMLKMLDPRIWEVDDMGSTFFVQNKTMEPAYSGFDDSEFDDYYDDEE